MQRRDKSVTYVTKYPRGGIDIFFGNMLIYYD